MSAKVIRKDIALNGKWMPSDDSITIGTNFKTQENMRPTKTHPKAIKGMTKINTSVINATYLKVRSAYQFEKAFPYAENHILAQAFNAGETASKLYENITAVPAQGNFAATEIWTDGSGAGRGRFSSTTNGQMAYANGVEACIHSGNEQQIASFVNFDPDQTFRYDFTREVNNDLTTTNNIATLKRVVDGSSFTVLLLHCDGADASTTFTDSSPTPHTVTAVGDAQIDTAYKKFGTGSGLFDGNGDYLTVLDHADFDVSGHLFTIDAWVRTTDLTANNTIYFHGDSGTDYLWFFVGSDGRLQVQVAESGVATGCGTIAGLIGVDEWHHVELGVSESGDKYQVFVDGVLRNTCDLNSLVNLADFAEDPQIGRYWYTGFGAGAAFFIGNIDEFRFSQGIVRHTANFTPQSSAYAAEKTHIYVGLTRPINYSTAVGGFKFYLGTVNTTAAAVSIYEYTASGWANMTIGTDGTQTGGDTTMGQDGTITVTSTGTPIQKVIDQDLLYWYWVVLDGVDDDITVTQVTAQHSMQPIGDIWDGVERETISALLYDSSAETYTDFTTQVYADEYDSTNTATYLSLASLATTKYLLFGYTEQTMGINITISEAVNTTANTSLTVERSADGINWTSVTGLNDGTSVDGKSFAKSGIVSWNPVGASSEHRQALTAQKTAKVKQKVFDAQWGEETGNNYRWVDSGYKATLSEPIPLYFYRLSFSEALSAGNIYLYYVTALTAPKELPTDITFPFFADNCLWLCRDNKARRSAPNQPEVWNGTESAELQFGSGTPLTAAGSLYMRTNASLYNMKIFFTESEMYSLTGSSLREYQPYPIETENGFSVGCGAPDTLKRISIPTEQGAQNAFIWLTYTGVYMYSGGSPVQIWDDIRHFFDPAETGSRRIKLSELPNATAFIDYDYMEYHLVFTDDSDVIRELVYNFRYNKSFEIDRTTNLKLRCGLDVKDTDGNHYSYGFIDTGYMERLENGTDFDGTNIISALQLGDFVADPDGAILLPSHLIAHRMNTVGEVGASTTIAITHYGDTNTDGTSLTAVNPAPVSNHRIDQSYEKVSVGDYTLSTDAIFHSLKYVKVGLFEPIYIGLEFEIQETEVQAR